MATVKEEGAIPDFLRMDQPLSSDPANAQKTGNWHGWPTKNINPVMLTDNERCRIGLAAGGRRIRTLSPPVETAFSRPPRNPATTNRPGRPNRVLTIDKGRFTVRRARLAPAMISTRVTEPPEGANARPRQPAIFLGAGSICHRSNPYTTPPSATCILRRATGELDATPARVPANNEW